MDLSFFPLTLEAIDQAAAESLCLFIGADERPLTGLAGLTDWRLQGRLSRLLRSGSLTGDAGEAVLTPPGARLGFRKLFVFGLGPAGQDEAALAQRLSDGLRRIAEAGVQEAALQLPAKLTAEAGIRALLAVADDKQGPSRAMVFSADPQGLMAALSQAASRGQAQVERRVVKVAGPGAKPVPQPPKKQPPQVAPALPKVSPLPFARDLPPPLITPPSPIPKASLPLATAVTQQRVTDEGAIAQAVSAPPPVAKPVVDESTAELVAAAVAAAEPDAVPVAPALPPSAPPPAVEAAPAAEVALPVAASAPPPGEAAAVPAAPQVSQPPGKRPAPPPPPPPPAAPKRPPPTPSQRYVPPEPTQNVFDRSKRKKR